MTNTSRSEPPFQGFSVFFYSHSKGAWKLFERFEDRGVAEQALKRLEAEGLKARLTSPDNPD